MFRKIIEIPGRPEVLEAEVCTGKYSSGGRWYALRVDVVRRIQRDGYTVREFCPTDGHAAIVNKTPRKSRAAEAQADTSARALLPEVVQYVCKKNSLPVPEEYAKERWHHG